MRNLIVFTVIVYFLTLTALGQAAAADKEVIDTLKRFYAGFDEGTFQRAEEYTTEDWNHINPAGGRSVGRRAVLEEVRAVHLTFLKGVTDTPEKFDVKYIDPKTAIVIVPSRLSAYTSPAGVKQENTRNIRTFIVVKRKGRWLITHDHNTFIAAP